MLCPCCGTEMEEGFVCGRRGSKLLWLPSDEKPPSTITARSVSKRNGLLIGEFCFPEISKLDFKLCRNCNTGVSKF